MPIIFTLERGAHLVFKKLLVCQQALFPLQMFVVVVVLRWWRPNSWYISAFWGATIVM